MIFLVLAGADLELRLLPSTQRLFGFSLLAQAGLAVGLVLITRQRFPEIAPTVTTVVLGAVVVFEIAGPLSARFTLDRCGESGREHTPPPLSVP
ncbi:MAG TPA: hypothetical protein VKA54_01060 [Gemmatimonadaceae bacterium]|nr:hypothetical protein [Gemmatimonadaceae bacterium]